MWLIIWVSSTRMRCAKSICLLVGIQGRRHDVSSHYYSALFCFTLLLINCSLSVSKFFSECSRRLSFDLESPHECTSMLHNVVRVIVKNKILFKLMNINLCLIQMGGIHLDIYPSLHTRPVSSRSGYCVDTLFRTNSELPSPTKDQLKTYTFPNRLATHMRSSSFNLYTIQQCSGPLKQSVKLSMWQANPPSKPQIQLVYMNYQCDKPSLQGNLPIKALVIISNKMWQAFAVRQFIHLTVSCISQVVPSCLLLLGN